jgi:hypothetical protein
MKNLRSVLFTLTVLLLATAAQAQQTKVQANIPFDFVAGDRLYPAGEYTLKSMNDSGVPIRIEGTPEATSAIVSTNPCAGRGPATSTKVVFHRMGDHYFLYQVWTEGNTLGRQFLKSREEMQLAQNHEKPETVMVAAIIAR